MRRCQRRQTGELKTFAGLQLGNLAFETGRIITKTVALVIGNVPAFTHQLNTLGRIVFNTCRTKRNRTPGTVYGILCGQ